MELFCDFFNIYSKEEKLDSFLGFRHCFYYNPAHRYIVRKITGLIRRTFFESDVQKTQEKRAASGLFAALLNNLPGFSPLLFNETNSQPQGEALLVSQNLWRKVSPKIQRLGSTW